MEGVLFGAKAKGVLMEAAPITAIAVSIIFGLLGFFLSLSSVEKREKKFTLGMTAIGLSMILLVSQLVILKRDSLEKEAQQQEFLRLKYSLVLDDDQILQKVHSFAIAKDNTLRMSIDLSPTSGTMGERFTARWIIIPCPKILSNKYKVIDPSNYGVQGITPLFPVISLLDNQKYYIGLIAVSEKKFSPADKVIVVTKHTNGLIEVESLDIETHTLDMSSFRFNPIVE